MSARRLATVGVYGFNLDGFLAALRDADVGLLIDVRQRRGVRGPDYSWANSLRLQRALADTGIAYSHRRDLAPTTELRRLGYREDARLGVGKRSRSLLSAEYRGRYTREILDCADLDSLVGQLPPASATALLCVEREPRACHRSLIAERLDESYGVRIEHLG